MKSYVKAYLFHELTSFPEWASLVASDAPVLADDDIVYIADDFTVLKDPIGGGEVVVDTPTEQWRAFCAASLDFAIPEDLAPIHESSDVGVGAE